MIGTATASSSQSTTDTPFKLSFARSNNLGGLIVFCDVDGTVINANNFNKLLIDSWKSVKDTNNQPAVREVYFLTSMSCSDIKTSQENINRPEIIAEFKRQGIDVKGMITSYDLYLNDLKNHILQQRHGEPFTYEELMKIKIADKAGVIKTMEETINERINHNISFLAQMAKMDINDIVELKNQIRENVKRLFMGMQSRLAHESAAIVGQYYDKYLVPLYDKAKQAVHQGKDVGLDADFQALAILEHVILVEFIGQQPNSSMHPENIGMFKGMQKAKLVTLFKNEAAHNHLAVDNAVLYEDDYTAVQAFEAGHGIWVKMDNTSCHTPEYYRGQLLLGLSRAGANIEEISDATQLNFALAYSTLKEDFERLKKYYDRLDKLQQIYYQTVLKKTDGNFPASGYAPLIFKNNIERKIASKNHGLLDKDIKILEDLLLQTAAIDNAFNKLQKYMSEWNALCLQTKHEENMAQNSWVGFGKSFFSHTKRNRQTAATKIQQFAFEIGLDRDNQSTPYREALEQCIGGLQERIIETETLLAKHEVSQNSPIAASSTGTTTSVKAIVHQFEQVQSASESSASSLSSSRNVKGKGTEKGKRKGKTKKTT